ncbi:MAG TPA: hypothetical protein VF360_00630 [Candidatus Methanoperedens sp.]
MTRKFQALDYMEAQSIMDSPIAKKRAIIRGHEFHYSTTECNRDVRFVYRLHRSKGIFEGMGLWSINSMAGYMHTHPASNSFDEFLQQCSKYRSR